MAARYSHPAEKPPSVAGLIEVNLRELGQLFETWDPAPFHEKELSRDAEEYIVACANEIPRDAPLALLVYLNQPAGLADEEAMLEKAVQTHFTRVSKECGQRLHEVFRLGRISLPIGLACLAAGHIAGEAVANLASAGPWATVLRESLVIGGWVAMWRPLETFLYDWWPILGERRIYERLSRMEVRIVYAGAPEPDNAAPADLSQGGDHDRHLDPSKPCSSNNLFPPGILAFASENLRTHIHCLDM